MNILNRQIELLDLLSQKNILSIKDVSFRFSVTERTVRNDIDSLNLLFNTPSIITVHKGYFRVLEYERFNQEFAEIKKQINYYNYRLSNDERIKIIVFILLYNDYDYITSQQLANRLLLSRSTIASDMNHVKKWFATHNINLKTVTRKGFRVRDHETPIREKLFDLAFESEYNSLYAQLIDTEIERKIDRKLIRDVVINSSLLSHFEFNEIGYHNIENYLLIVTNRLQMDKTVDSIPQENLKSNKELTALSQNILANLWAKLSIDHKGTLINEGLMFSEILDEFRLPNVSSSEQANLTNLDVQMKISSFVFSVCMGLRITDKMEFSTYQTLVFHIQNTIFYRENYNVSWNPFIKELQDNYPDIFEQVYKYIGNIESLFPHVFTVEEISFIAMHFAVELEKAKLRREALNALLIGPNKKPEEMLTRVKLKNELNIVVHDVIPAYMLESQNLENLDLIISTVPIYTENCDIIHVSPLLPETDIKRIDNFIRENDLYRKSRNYRMSAEINKILSYIKEYNDILSSSKHTDADIKNIQINALNRRYYSENKEQKNPVEWFWANIDTNRILLDKVVDDCYAAIRLAGEILLANNDIQEEYIDLMINIVKNDGPYIVFFPGVAIAHAAPNGTVNKLGVSFVRLKEPVNFNHKTNDPVRFVIAFADPNNNHLGLFYHIAQCMAKESLQQLILDAENASDVINIIKLFEIDYFQNKNK